MAIADPINYVEGDKEYSDFIIHISDNTGEHYGKLWLENARANKPLVKKYGWAAETLQGKHQGKTVVFLGASPAVKKQLRVLKKLREDPNFVFVGVSSNIEYLLDNELHPDYLMFADADPKMERFWQNVDFSKTKDITLISSVCAYPALAQKWYGDVKWLAIWTGIKKAEKKLVKWFHPVNGCGEMFYALLSQMNTGVALAYTVFESKILIFVGNEFSFAKESDQYYVDRKDIKDTWLRKPHLDIYGNMVYTTYTLLSLKMVLEGYLGKISGDGWFFNCTEAGIFGITKKFGPISWIHQLPLSTGIAQANNIMRTGEPFYS